MSIRKTPLVGGEYFHVYNRGNNKQVIFIDDEDRNHFIKLLYLCNSTKKINFREDIVKKKIEAWDLERGEQIVSIGAWVLMPNHFHIYITSIESSQTPGVGQESPIAMFMRKLSVSYSKYFNTRHNRTGSLFEGRFRSVHVGDDIQAKYLFSYIHLNPIKLIKKDWRENGILDKEKAIEFLGNYKYSSYVDFLDIKRPENKILNINSFPNYFSTKDKFKSEIFEWISAK